MKVTRFVPLGFMFPQFKPKQNVSKSFRSIIVKSNSTIQSRAGIVQSVGDAVVA